MFVFPVDREQLLLAVLSRIQLWAVSLSQQLS